MLIHLPWAVKVDVLIVPILEIFRLTFVSHYVLPIQITILKTDTVHLLVQEGILLILNLIVVVYKLALAPLYLYMEILYTGVLMLLIAELIYMGTIIQGFVVLALDLYHLAILLLPIAFTIAHRHTMEILIQKNVFRHVALLYLNMLIMLQVDALLYVH
jgi:hypothetical protein